MGATLISIHSAEENEFIRNFANRYRTKGLVWIGAKRNNSLNYFEWTNGEEFNYSNWDSGEPKTLTDPESHAYMLNRGTWVVNIKNTNGLWYTCLYTCQRYYTSE